MLFSAMATSKAKLFADSAAITIIQTKNDSLPKKKATKKPDDRITSSTIFALQLNRAALVFPGDIKFVQNEEDPSGHKVVLKSSRVRQVISYVLLGKFIYGIVERYLESVSNFNPATQSALKKFTSDIQQFIWVIGLIIILDLQANPLRIERAINALIRIERKLEESGFKRIGVFYAKYLPRLLITIFLATSLPALMVHSQLMKLDHLPNSLRGFAALVHSKGQGSPLNLTAETIENYNFGNSPFEVIFEMSLGVFNTFSKLYSNYTEMFCSVLTLAMAFSSCLLVYTFQKGLKSPKLEVPLDVVLNITEDFVTLFDNIEDAIGWSVFYQCFACIPYFAFRIQDVAYGNWQEQVIYFGYAFTFIVTNVSASLCNPWLKYVATWYRQQLGSSSSALALSTKVKSMFGPNIASTERRFDVLMQEMSVREIGIRGKMFTGTFSFFGQVCGLVITYAVLWYQLKT